MAVPSGRNGKSIVEYTSKQLSYALDRTRLKINFFILSINKHLHYVLNIYQYTDWEIIRTILASKNYTKIFFRRKNPTHRYLISETRDNIVSLFQNSRRQIWRIESNVGDCEYSKLESELVTNYSWYWSWENDFRDGLWDRREGRKGRERVKGQPFKCWCTNDGPSMAAPCANLTEGITSLVNGCPSYGSRVTTVCHPRYGATTPLSARWISKIFRNKCRVIWPTGATTVFPPPLTAICGLWDYTA